MLQVSIHISSSSWKSFVITQKCCPLSYHQLRCLELSSPLEVIVTQLPLSLRAHRKPQKQVAETCAELNMPVLNSPTPYTYVWTVPPPHQHLVMSDLF